MRNLGKLFLLLVVAVAAQAQNTWDNSGNSMLSGTYYFRQVIYVPGDQYGDLAEAVSLYGNISFDGNGGYTLTNGQWYVYDSSQGYGSYAVTNGTYSISASGYGFISSPYVTGDSIYGLVSAQGIFVGSSTDNTYGYNDIFIAAPLASPLPTASTFSGTYVFSNLDLTTNLAATQQGYEGSQYNLGMTFTLTANGACGLGTTTITTYEGSSASPVFPAQQSSLPNCIFSNGAAVVTFPANGAYMSGQKYFYFSKDGNFVFGGSPYTGASPWDMIVGVRVGSGTQNFSGLYYQAGIDDVGGELDTYYGSLDLPSGQTPGSQTIYAHQRIEDLFGSPATTDSTFTDTDTLTSGSSYATSTTHYTVGAGGAIRIGSGIGPYLGLSVALQAPTVAPTVSSTGVFLNPQGIVNSGSFAPFTAGIAPGELLVFINGTNQSNPASGAVASLSNGPIQIAGSPFPPTLNQVQVSIGGLPAPIYYVSPSQISAIVPYGVAGPIADIQVTNNGVLSNSVPVFVNQSAPGPFTQSVSGIGDGATEHNADGSLVTPSNPAVIGEVVAIYLTGLGAVTPAITDGAPGPAPPNTLSEVPSGDVAVYIGTTPANAVLATVAYAGLAPGLSGLYQIDVTIPTGLTAGENHLYISGPDAYTSQATIPISTATAAVETPAAAAVPALNTLRPGRVKVTPKAKRLPGPRGLIGGAVKP